MTHEFPLAYVINSLEGGGAQSPIPRIFKALEKAGVQPKLFALARRNGKALPRLQNAGIEPAIYRGSERNHIGALHWLGDEVRHYGARGIFTSLTRATLLGQIVGARQKLPVVSWQHNAYLKPANEKLLRWRAKKSGLWVADSETVARLTVERLRILPDRCFVWPIFSTDPQAARAVPYNPGEPLRVGSLGRLHQAKGYDVLLQALHLLQAEGWRPPIPVEITIAGQGDALGHLRQAAQELHIAGVTFAGFLSETRQFLAAQHLYVQPSRREGFCIAAHEAMQAGLPVLASDVGQMPHTLAAHTLGVAGGVVVPPQDPHALALALKGLIDQPDHLSAMGQAAFNAVHQAYPADAFDRVAQKIGTWLKNA